MHKISHPSLSMTSSIAKSPCTLVPRIPSKAIWKVLWRLIGTSPRYHLLNRLPDFVKSGDDIFPFMYTCE